MICRNRIALLGLFVSLCCTVFGQERVVPFKYGDMDQWIVREIYQSKMIGRQTKHLYEIGPHDPIRGD